MTDDATKLTQLLQPEQAKPSVEEYMAKLAADPRFKVVPPSGKTFIIPMPGGMPLEPERPE
jgi:hypothetical protein